MVENGPGPTKSLQSMASNYLRIPGSTSNPNRDVGTSRNMGPVARPILAICQGTSIILAL